jgi:hypothetical protein
MLRLSVVSLCLASSTIAFAQQADAPAGQPAGDNVVATATDAAAPAPAADANAATAVAPEPAPVATPSTSGLRNGFSLSAGQEFGGDRDVSATMFGIDWRIGWRINEPISVYLHSHMSFGSGSDNTGDGFTGTFASALMAEYLLPMRVFVAGGAGYGVLNNPNGPIVAARAGYYPFKTEAVGKKRRLNVSLDWRSYFANQGYGTVNQVQLTLGYDRF